jgi:ethanolamine utilization protein EutN
LLAVLPLDADGSIMEGSPIVAADIIGAGIGETVLCLCGSSARIAAGGEKIPVDAAVAGIVDGYEIEKREKHR